MLADLPKDPRGFPERSGCNFQCFKQFEEGCQRLARGEKVRSRPCAARGKQIPYQPRMTNYIQGCHRTHVQDPQSLGKRTASTDCHPRRTAISPSSKRRPQVASSMDSPVLRTGSPNGTNGTTRSHNTQRPQWDHYLSIFMSMSMSLNRRGTAVPFRPQGHNSRHSRQAIILPGSRQDKPSDSRCSVSALLYRRSNIVLVVTCRSCEDDWKAARAKTCLACGSDRHRSGQSPHFAHTPPISFTSAIPIFLRTKGNAMPIPGFVECLLVAIWLYPWVF